MFSFKEPLTNSGLIHALLDLLMKKLNLEDWQCYAEIINRSCMVLQNLFFLVLFENTTGLQNGKCSGN